MTPFGGLELCKIKILLHTFSSCQPFWLRDKCIKGTTINKTLTLCPYLVVHSVEPTVEVMRPRPLRRSDPGVNVIKLFFLSVTTIYK
jgi:hypothetical protein